MNSVEGALTLKVFYINGKLIETQILDKKPEYIIPIA